MKRLALVIAALLLAGFAIVAFSDSPKIRDAALAPITVTPSDPVEPAPPVDSYEEGETAAVQPAPAQSALDFLPTPPVLSPAEPSDCEAELRELGVAFEPQPPIDGEAGCGVDRPLKVTSVGIALRPEVITRCTVAKALAIWAKDVVVPSAKLHLNATPNAISTGDSYQCRARRGGDEVKISEHAAGNAVDITGIEFADHAAVKVQEHSDKAQVAFQAAIRGGACAYFTTVLGPGTNGAHADHLHFDLIRRDNGYRICE